jgi:hypothetical protein
VKGNVIAALVLVLAAGSPGCFYDVDGGRYEPPEDTDTGDPDSGLGVSCESDEDCAEFAAESCTVNDYTTEFYCTFLDCTAEQCEGDYECCDCTGVTGFDAILCLSAEDASMASSMAGCTCE